MSDGYSALGQKDDEVESVSRQSTAWQQQLTPAQAREADELQQTIAQLERDFESQPLLGQGSSRRELPLVPADRDDGSTAQPEPELESGLVRAQEQLASVTPPRAPAGSPTSAAPSPSLASSSPGSSPSQSKSRSTAVTEHLKPCGRERHEAATLIQATYRRFKVSRQKLRTVGVVLGAFKDSGKVTSWDSREDDHIGVPRSPAANQFGGDAASPIWRERPVHHYMEAKRKQQRTHAGNEAQTKAKQNVDKSVGPYAETLGKSKPILYGELRFEETGRLVPYLIIPEPKRDPQELLDALRGLKHVDRSQPNFGQSLAKPRMLFDVGSSDGSYLSWADEVYEKDELSEAWGWKQWTCDCGVKNRFWPLNHPEDEVCAACPKAKPKRLKTKPKQAKLKNSRSGHFMVQSADGSCDSGAENPEPVTAPAGSASAPTRGWCATGPPPLVKESDNRSGSCWRCSDDEVQLIYYEPTGEQAEAEMPVTLEKFHKLIEAKTVEMGTRCWKEGYDDWRPLRECLELLPVIYSTKDEVLKLDETRMDPTREFVEQLMLVTNATLSSVQESNSWLFTAAGRDAAAQLYGDTIERFRGPLDELVWVQYAALCDPRLFGKHNHDGFVQQLRASAVKLSNVAFDKPKSNPHYPSNRMHYPSSFNLQKEETPAELLYRHMQFQDKFDGIDLHPNATHLLFFDTGGHNHEQHMKGHTDVKLPHDHVHALKQALREQGVAEGMLLVNGGLHELNRAKHYVSQLNPVITFKSVGGASELMARTFQQDQRHREDELWRAELREEYLDIDKAVQEHADLEREVTRLQQLVDRTQSTSKTAFPRLDKDLELAKSLRNDAEARVEREKKDIADVQRTIADRQDKERERKLEMAALEGYNPDASYPATAMRFDLQGRGRYFVRQDADPAEMVVVDVVPRNRGVLDNLQKQMSAMMGRQGDALERTTLGFDALEGELIDKAWENAGMYSRNMVTQEKLSFFLDLVVNIFNVVIVAIVVAKQWNYPNMNNAVKMCENDGQLSTAEEHDLTDSANYDDEAVFKGMTTFLILMPIFNGVFITLTSQLDPHTKASALAWADAVLESETYKYRTRALEYSNSSKSSAGWQTKDAKQKIVADKDSAEPQQQAKLPTTTFKKRCKDINDALYSDSTFSQANLVYDEDPCCTYCCQALMWCWDDIIVYWVLGALVLGILALMQGIWSRGELDVELNPGDEPGEMAQTVGVGVIILTSTIILIWLISVCYRRHAPVSSAADSMLYFMLSVLLVGVVTFAQGYRTRGELDVGINPGDERGEMAESIGVLVITISSAIILVYCLVKCGRRFGSKSSDRDSQRTAHTIANERRERLREIRARTLTIMSEETDKRDKRAKQTVFKDDGYSRLEATEYLACRTEVELHRMQRDVQPLGFTLKILKVLTLLSTTVSVALGSFDLDIFIAASTAFVSFFTTAQENGDYKREVEYTNLSIKKLKAAEQEFLSLTFAERHDPRHKDRLVRQTEEAIMAVREAQYSSGPDALQASKRSGGKNSEDGEISQGE